MVTNVKTIKFPEKTTLRLKESGSHTGAFILPTCTGKNCMMACNILHSRMHLTSNTHTGRSPKDLIIYKTEMKHIGIALTNK